MVYYDDISIPQGLLKCRTLAWNLMNRWTSFSRLQSRKIMSMSHRDCGIRDKEIYDQSYAAIKVSVELEGVKVRLAQANAWSKSEFEDQCRRGVVVVLSNYPCQILCNVVSLIPVQCRSACGWGSKRPKVQIPARPGLMLSFKISSSLDACM